MATTYEDVVAVFESTFLEKVALSDDLVFQWFKMACGEFSTQISQLYFNNENYWLNTLAYYLSILGIT